MADLFGPVFRVGGWDITPAMEARQVGQAQALPLLAGLLLRRSKPRWASLLQGPLDRIANGLLLLLLLIVAVLVKTDHLLVPFVAANGLAVLFMALIVMASLAIGSLLAGPSSQERIGMERITVALVMSMRNPGLTLLFATTYGAGMDGLKLAILAYLLVTVLVSVLFLRWQQCLRLRLASGNGPASDSGARRTGGDSRRRSDRH
jgi:BASS family bile acid:Na+ symporter